MTSEALVSMVEREAAGYPERLSRLGRPPGRLWFRGTLPTPAMRTVALVGSRAASGAGCERSATLAAALGRLGCAVISGGAFGIDAAAHEGALAAGAPTYAVLGCGVDVVYPDRHGPLFARIVAGGGGLCSEYAPGTQPRAGQFPARNRLVAALSEVVIVVEAAGRSGALITAGEARRLGVPVLAVPGSPGADRLLAAGKASALSDADDVTDVLAGRPRRPVQGSLFVAAPAFADLAAALAAQPDSAAGLARRLGRPLPETMSRLAQAELDGCLRRVAGGRYEVVRAH